MSNFIQPSILPGFMELLPMDQVELDQMKKIIEETYKKYAFLPIDTPVIEKEEILLAKGGGETQKQIYRIDSSTKDMALRFDLTVPLARYVAEHFSELNFPFRRYHIAKVYRGERNQKGRYREFYQADIDIIGNETLDIRNDAEIPVVIQEIFQKLCFEEFAFHMNNRKLLNGLFEELGITDSVMALRIIDKLAKIGREKVVEELKNINISEDAIESLLAFLDFEGTNDEILDFCKQKNFKNSLYHDGVNELAEVYQYMKLFGIAEENIVIDLSITRGLDYYTGTVFETFLKGYEKIGSVCSGGRYDDLASNYTKQKLPGIGISIGITRLYYQLKQADLIRFSVKNPVEALIIPMKGMEEAAVKLVKRLRAENKKVQIYFETGKMKKKFAYADKEDIPFVIILGEDELAKGMYSLRNMKTGEQELLPIDDLILAI